MQVELHLVDDVAADVVYDPAHRTLTFTPKLVRGGPLIDIGGIRTVGKKGNVSQSLLTVNKATGVVSTQGRRGMKLADSLPFDSDAPPKSPKKSNKKKELPVT